MSTKQNEPLFENLEDLKQKVKLSFTEEFSFSYALSEREAGIFESRNLKGADASNPEEILLNVVLDVSKRKRSRNEIKFNKLQNYFIHMNLRDEHFSEIVDVLENIGIRVPDYELVMQSKSKSTAKKKMSMVSMIL